MRIIRDPLKFDGCVINVIWHSMLRNAPRNRQIVDMGLPTPVDSVGPVMKKTSDDEIRNSQNANEKIVGTGTGETSMEPPKMKDSGQRRTFSTGAVRDRGEFKPRPDLISPHANLREGAWLAKGAEKYGARNYEKGIPISECIASLYRHLIGLQLGLTDEDHAAAIRTNAGFILHFEEEIKAGRMDPSIDDMPHYAKLTTRYLIPADSLYAIDYSAFSEVQSSDVISVSDPSLIKAVEEAPDPEPDAEPDPPTFYIAGPMRGLPLYNFPAFDEAARHARSQGLNVISPAEADRAAGIDPVADPIGVSAAEATDPEFVKNIVRRDCTAIINLDKEQGDGLILLPGWRQSTGARAEIALAIWLGLDFKGFSPNGYLFNYPVTELRFNLFHQCGGA